MIDLHRLDEILTRAPSLHIAIVGDYFLDRYLVTDPALAEVSIETGLEARQVVVVRSNPGAAGTVTSNLAALGVGRIDAVGVIGDDGDGYDLRRGLERTGVRTEHLVANRDRFTPTYMKPMVRDAAGVEIELERLDIKNRTPLPAALENQLIESIRGLATPAAGRPVDAIIVADQVQERNCGVVTDRVRQALVLQAERNPGLLVFADSRTRIAEFTGISIKPNRQEAASALGMDATGDGRSFDDMARVGRDLARRGKRPVYITLGADGIAVCTPAKIDHAGGVVEADVEHVPAPPATEQIDIVGAGDSATAGIVCALCAGATPAEAAAVGNLCAAVTILKLGTTGTASPAELRARLAACR